MSDELRAWVAQVKQQAESDHWGYCESGCLTMPIDPEEAEELYPELTPGIEVKVVMGQLIAKVEELAGALELLVSAARGIPHNGDNLVMSTLELAIEEAESNLRAPGGGRGE